MIAVSDRRNTIGSAQCSSVAHLWGGITSIKRPAMSPPHQHPDIGAITTDGRIDSVYTYVVFLQSAPTTAAIIYSDACLPGHQQRALISITLSITPALSITSNRTVAAPIPPLAPAIRIKRPFNPVSIFSPARSLLANYRFHGSGAATARYNYDSVNDTAEQQSIEVRLHSQVFS